MNSLTIRDAWTSFDSAVVPLDASPLQHVEMRRAFYAGAIAVIDITAAIADIPDCSVGVRILERLHDEKHAFLYELRQYSKGP